MNNSEPARALLTLYSRRWCHLCHEMEEALVALQAQLPFDLEVFDVDATPELERRYDEKVPVLAAGEVELCHWRLDEQVVRAYLLNFR